MTTRDPFDEPRRTRTAKPVLFEYVDEARDEYLNPPPRSQEPEADDTIGLPELLAMLRRRIWLVLACVVLGGAVGFYLYTGHVPSYPATATIAVEDPRSQMPAEAGGYDRYWYAGWIDPLQSTLEVMNSSAVLGRIVDQEGLRLVPASLSAPANALAEVEVGEFALPDSLNLSFSATGVTVESQRVGETVEAQYGRRIEVGEISFRVPERPPVPDATFVLIPREVAIAQLAAGLGTEQRPETNVIDVTYTAGDPGVAQRVVNRLVATWQDYSS